MTTPASLTTFLVILLSFTLNKCFVGGNNTVLISINISVGLRLKFRFSGCCLHPTYQLERETKDIKVHLRPREWHTLTA